MIQWTPGFINRLVFLVDAMLMLICSAVLYRPLFGHPVPVTIYQTAVFTAIDTLAFLFVMGELGAYRLEQYIRPVRPYFDLLIGFAVKIAVAYVVAHAFLPSQPNDSAWYADRWLLVFAVFAVYRAILYFSVHQLIVTGGLRRKVVVVGTGPQGRAMVRHVTNPAFTYLYELVGVYSAEAIDEDLTVPDPMVKGDVDALCRYAQDNPVDLIIVALPWRVSVSIYKQIEAVQRVSADVVMMFEENGFNPRFAEITAVGNRTALQIAHKPLKGTQGLLKQIEDYFVAGLGVLMVSPVLLLAALAIRLESPGPILFRQLRVGFNNKPFMVYKFRSMHVDPEDDGSIGIGRDNARITKVGAFLRRTSIDELPQLFNVLRGNMSIVGPRPHVPNMRVGSESYYKAVREYAMRYRIKPGITGWAQINGMRGGIHNIDKAKRGVDLDISYIENWSLWLDIKIMLRTLAIGMVGRDVF
ncbi:MAG TPA: exopolysaccharide biosynthesis polyprenyl glycosylphosphotransferase [Magnetospirillaceae bacterium]|jgi:putative colanic acid biosynthesis UDP-glucose lipid carrier transferase